MCWRFWLSSRNDNDPKDKKIKKTQKYIYIFYLLYNVISINWLVVLVDSLPKSVPPGEWNSHFFPLFFSFSVPIPF